MAKVTLTSSEKELNLCTPLETSAPYLSRQIVHHSVEYGLHSAVKDRCFTAMEFSKSAVYHMLEK